MKASLKPDQEIHLKPLIMETCYNLFSLYMCSVRFDYDNVEFKTLVRSFDEIFWEINQGYAVDFLPWLSPFYASHMKNVESWAKTIREFILKRVIDSRAEKLHERSEDDDDFTDALLRSLSKEENVTKNTIIFMLEDFLGGHSAIGELTHSHVAQHFIDHFLFAIIRQSRFSRTRLHRKASHHRHKDSRRSRQNHKQRKAKSFA